MQEYKKELEEKATYAANHLDDVVREREAAEKKNGELVKEVDEIKISLAGGSDAKQDLMDKIARLEDAKAALAKELAQVVQRHTAERETIDGLAQTMRKIESSQGSLGKELEEAERRLAQVEEEKKEKEEQIRQMKEEVAHQEEMLAKLGREKRTINDSKLKEEESIQVRRGEGGPGEGMATITSVEWGMMSKHSSQNIDFFFGRRLFFSPECHNLSTPTLATSLCQKKKK